MNPATRVAFVLRGESDYITYTGLFTPFSAENTHRMAEQKSALKTIVTAGLLAGTLDALAAMALTYFVYDRNPQGVFKYIASGIFGKEAFAGNWDMIFSGLIFHFLIAMTWALFFFLLYPKIQLLSRNKVATGMVYGVVIWLVMNLAVLPLSNVPQGPITLSSAITGMVIHMVAVGLPIVIVVHKHFGAAR
jgi:hypothetical protein